MTKATDVAEIFIAAAQRHGPPASALTDSGCIYTAAHRGGKVVMETLLETLGVTYKHSSPYHPQTCGKVERFHQTETAAVTAWRRALAHGIGARHWRTAWDRLSSMVDGRRSCLSGSVGELVPGVG